ncbi:protein kinase domain-containing protein [Rhodoferax sp.]|uniref:protein kinase domain-containing protein n=1 Tax=Rhodoferax sp. TaxID=50421 RepID=UPI002755B683|nr:protein kinase [Rhodoferax sp.]
MKAHPLTIGKYSVERELGRGASGTVYLGYDRFRGSQVAIKQTHASLLAEPSQAARYRRLLHNEATLVARLSHPHIVALLDADEAADPPYLVFEYVDGQTLSSFTTPDHLLPVAEVLDIAFKCCHALDYAHRQGLVHRDIKPANLMLRRDGELKLADFGTALSLRGEDTQIAGLVGSPSYMSPEQIKEQALTSSSDMFSLAVVVYELLTGRNPFAADSTYSTIYRIHTEIPAALSLIRPELPIRLDEVVARALAKHPNDRYSSWTDFAQSLLAINRSLARLPTQTSEGERFARLRGLAFFADFSEVALWETLRLGKWFDLPRGKVMMREGQPGDSFCLIIDGEVAVSRNARVLSTIRRGSSIGEMTYLQSNHRLRTATVVASTDVVAFKIRNEALRQASIELQGEFDKVFIKLLVNRLIATNQQLADWDLVLE